MAYTSSLHQEEFLVYVNEKKTSYESYAVPERMCLHIKFPCPPIKGSRITIKDKRYNMMFEVYATGKHSEFVLPFREFYSPAYSVEHKSVPTYTDPASYTTTLVVQSDDLTENPRSQLDKILQDFT